MTTAIVDESPRLRGDLLVRPDGEGGRGRVVKDPVTDAFYRFEAAEGFILDHLDGAHTAVDIQIGLASELGEALALEDVQDFIDLLRDKKLLETGGPALPSSRPDLGAQVVAALESGGFRLRNANEPLPPGVTRTARTQQEALKFDEAIASLKTGRFQAALRAFDDILIANPGNQRARALREILIRAGSQAALEATNEPAKKNDNPLYLRVPFFDPDPIFSALEPALRFVWTRGFVVVYLALLAVSGWIIWGHWREMLAELPTISAALLASGFLVAAILQTAVHEFAHGLTCRHYGGKVPELGFLLILFFLPALYVDVSDAWLFRRRSQRVFVSLAGPMFDLGVAALAAVAWWVMPPTPIRTAAVILMAASGASVLLNLNPLIRLDGYYILSDLSGIPNLRATAVGMVGRAIRRIRGVRVGDEVGPKGSARFFVLGYGVLSTLYMILILSILGSLVMGYAADMAGLWGPALVLSAVLYFLRKPLKMLGGALAGWARGMSPARVMRLAAVVAVLAVVALYPWTLEVGGPVTLDAERSVAVRPEISGNVAEILVAEGERVEEGDLVARLDTSELETQRAMLRSDIHRAQAKLDLELRGPELEQVRQARERVEAAEVEVGQSRSTHSRLERLQAEGLVSRERFEQSATELRIREGALRAAREELRLIEKGARPEIIAAARAEVDRLNTELADIERRLVSCELRAPASGIVVTPNLDDRQGERLGAGGLLLEIAASEAVSAEIRVLESEIGDVQPGLPVRFVFSAYPSKRFEGEVVEIAPAAETDDLGRALFRVRANVEDPDRALRPGMTGAAKVRAGRWPLARVAYRRVLRMIDPSLL